MRLLLDEMFAAAVARAARDRGVDAIAIQARPDLRGLPDHEVFLAAQLERRTVVTENVADFVAVEATWRAEHDAAHYGVVLVAPRTFPRHRRGAVGRITTALVELAGTKVSTRGTVVWLAGSDNP